MQIDFLHETRRLRTLAVRVTAGGLGWLGLLAILLLPHQAAAHTTVLVPYRSGQRQSIRIIHFHPATGSGLMGIRLGVEDSPYLKGLESIFMVHRGKRIDLSGRAVADYYTVRGEKRETYSILLNRENGFFKPGDYIIVVLHRLHWKKSEGIYRGKVAKFCLNYFGTITDWPHRVLENLPEIVPLAEPRGIRTGTLFRAEAIDDRGRRIAHARIEIEYLNYPAGISELETTGPGRLPEGEAESVVFSGGDGSFSFIPPKKGLWTFTLVDGDAGKALRGKRVEYDSSLSIMVK